MDVPIERQTFENDETVVGKYAKACRCDKAIEYYKRSMEMQKKPRYTDASMAIAQICEITGDVVAIGTAAAVAAE